MLKSLIAVIVLLAAAGAMNAAAQGPVLTGEIEAARIVADAEKGEIALPAETVYPDDRVEYTLRYVNTGSMQASGVDLVGPVPAGTIYLEETATDTPLLRPVFSIDDGRTWQAAPVMVEVACSDGTIEMRPADPAIITHVRWSMAGVLDVGEEVAVSYRVRVK